MPPFSQEMYIGEVETNMKAIVVGERFPDYQYMDLTMLESGGGRNGGKKCSSGNLSAYVRQLNRCTLCTCHSIDGFYIL